MTDYYLEDRARLNGQPKRTIGNYVEQNGILVPRRFDSLAEARAAGVPFLARSEHPQDYDGASGIVPTLKDRSLTDVFSPEELKRKALYDKKFGSHHDLYCRLLNADPEQFAGEVSFSLWQHVDGYNRTVVADSAIPERYHVMTARTVKPTAANYAFIEKGKVEIQYGTPLAHDLEEGLLALVEQYETIRTLPHFDPHHCPIMEFQTTVDGTTYFLQYHRTQDFTPTSFVLERPALGNEIMSLFVRGATPLEGMTLDVTVIKAGFPLRAGQVVHLPEYEEAAFLSMWILYDEVMARKRKCNIHEAHQVEDDLIPAAQGHGTRSALFKPELSIVVLNNALISEQEFRTLLDKCEETGQDQKIKVCVISDGRKAYLKRVD